MLEAEVVDGVGQPVAADVDAFGHVVLIRTSLKDLFDLKEIE